jgi:glycosyltransferase involved in cell wall biosynthesis
LNEKVLHVITTIDRGGAENHLADLARAQIAAGFRVAVCYLKGNGYWTAELRRAGVEVYSLGITHYYDIRGVIRLRRLLREWQPQLVHAHMPPAELFTRLALLASSEQTPLVITKHNDEPFHRGPGAKFLRQWVGRRATRVITISSAVADYLARTGFRFPAEKIAVVRYGIDTQAYDDVTPEEVSRIRREWSVENSLVIGTIARLTAQKNIHALLDAFERFLSASKVDAKLVIVGRGEMERELKEHADQLGIGASVVWAGFREDIPPVVRSFDIFALSSVYEGFGLVLLEAMAAAQPVVATAVSAIPEIVVDGETGVLVSGDVPLGLASAFARLTNAEERERLGEAGRKRARRHFTVQGMVESTNALYAAAWREAGAERAQVNDAPPKHILQIITSIDRGGAENHLLDLTRSLVARGYSVSVCYLKGSGYWSEALLSAGAAVHPLNIRNYGDIRGVARLVRLIRNLRPDLIHAHLPPAELYARLALLFTGRHTAVVATKHNDEPFFRGPGAWMLRAWVARRVCRVIAISSAVATYLAKTNFRFPTQRIVTIYNGIHPAPYEDVSAESVTAIRREWGVDEFFVVGTVARLTAQKNIRGLIEGFAQFVQRQITPARLVIVGRGELKAELERQSEALGLSGAVVWAGFREDIPAVVSGFDVFVLSSAYEGFGLVLLEAMAASKPIVATAVSAIPEIVIPGETGILVSGDIASGIADALVQLTDSALREKFGQSGRERARVEFTIDRMVDRILEVYAACWNEYAATGRPNST